MSGRPRGRREEPDGRRGAREGERAGRGGSQPGGRERTSGRGGGGESGAGDRDLLVGWHPVLEAIRARTRPISRILIQEGRRDARAAEMTALAREAGVPVQQVPAEALARLVPRGLPHQGIAAEIAPAAYADADQLLESVTARSLFVVLDEVQDPRNLGAIARTAAAVGATAMILPLHRSASLTPAAEKASAGGLLRLPVARVPNLSRFLEKMEERGVVRVGLDARANDLYTEIPGDAPLALVLGGEEKGLRPVVRAACDRLVRIPIPGPMESLNVSVAAAIALYEVLRARSRRG